MANDETSFGESGIPLQIVDYLASKRFPPATENELAALRSVLAGRDVAAQVNLGLGKIVAYGVPLLVRVNRADSSAPTGLVLVPDEARAGQIAGELGLIGGLLGVETRVLTLRSGDDRDAQTAAIRDGADVVVATPQHLRDLARGQAGSSVDLSQFEVVVVDEADRMTGNGLLADVGELLSQTKSSHQTLLLAATYGNALASFVDVHMRPGRFDVITDSASPWIVHRAVAAGVASRAPDSETLPRPSGWYWQSNEVRGTPESTTARRRVRSFRPSVGRSGAGTELLRAADESGVRFVPSDAQIVNAVFEGSGDLVVRGGRPDGAIFALALPTLPVARGPVGSTPATIIIVQDPEKARDLADRLRKVATHLGDQSPRVWCFADPEEDRQQKSLTEGAEVLVGSAIAVKRRVTHGRRVGVEGVTTVLVCEPETVTNEGPDLQALRDLMRWLPGRRLVFSSEPVDATADFSSLNLNQPQELVIGALGATQALSQ